MSATKKNLYFGASISPQIDEKTTLEKGLQKNNGKCVLRRPEVAQVAQQWLPRVPQSSQNGAQDR